jgi:hypothetical protein
MNANMAQMNENMVQLQQNQEVIQQSVAGQNQNVQNLLTKLEINGRITLLNQLASPWRGCLMTKMFDAPPFTKIQCSEFAERSDQCDPLRYFYCRPDFAKQAILDT